MGKRETENYKSKRPPSESELKNIGPSRNCGPLGPVAFSFRLRVKKETRDCALKGPWPFYEVAAARVKLRGPQAVPARTDEDFFVRQWRNRWTH
jgi:hypothetical protein